MRAAATAPHPADAPCPCGRRSAAGRPLGYAACCGRWHAGPAALAAPDAESLMRSRYSAFVLGLGEYLQATWHATTRPAEPPAFTPGLRWLGLEVKAAHDTGAGRAEVRFVARSKFGGRAHRHVETSRFVHEGGRWFYVDGDVHPDGA